MEESIAVTEKLDGKGPLKRCHQGDLICVSINGRIVLGVVNNDIKVSIIFGDMEYRVPEGYGRVIAKNTLSPEAGKYIGQSFANLDEIRAALRPYRIQ